MARISKKNRRAVWLQLFLAHVSFNVLVGCAIAPIGNMPSSPASPVAEKKDEPENAPLLSIRAKPKAAEVTPLSPLLAKDHAVDWWLVFKFNAASFPGCGSVPHPENACIFGGSLQSYPASSQQFVYASSLDPHLQQGTDCVGTTATADVTDPVGATFGQIYDSNDVFYVTWNDQFYGDPAIAGCGNSCAKPWGHSKGILAWNSSGDGVVMQVSTPSWPAAGSERDPRESDGNTLGCVGDNNIKVSQHFFALKLTQQDLLAVLSGLRNASVVTDVDNAQIVRNGGPKEIQDIVTSLGKKTSGRASTMDTLSSGIRLISKPSALHVPPWQMVSSLLNGTPLRAATWWASPKIPSTDSTTPIGCWDASLAKPGAVEIATTGQWKGKVFGLTGGPSTNNNHAKLGVSKDPARHYVITGDLNQQGALADDCASSQNGRGGLFFVLDNAKLFESVTDLLKGDSAPAAH